MAAEPLSGYAGAALATVRESFLADVAGRACGAAVDRKLRIVKQFFPEAALGFGERIVGRERNGRWPAKRGFKRRQIRLGFGLSR